MAESFYHSPAGRSESALSGDDLDELPEDRQQEQSPPSDREPGELLVVDAPQQIIHVSQAPVESPLQIALLNVNAVAPDGSLHPMNVSVWRLDISPDRSGIVGELTSPDLDRSQIQNVLVAFRHESTPRNQTDFVSISDLGNATNSRNQAVLGSDVSAHEPSGSQAKAVPMGDVQSNGATRPQPPAVPVNNKNSYSAGEPQNHAVLERGGDSHHASSQLDQHQAVVEDDIDSESTSGSSSRYADVDEPDSYSGSGFQIQDIDVDQSDSCNSSDSQEQAAPGSEITADLAADTPNDIPVSNPANHPSPHNATNSENQPMAFMGRAGTDGPQVLESQEAAPSEHDLYDSDEIERQVAIISTYRVPQTERPKPLSRLREDGCLWTTGALAATIASMSTVLGKTETAEDEVVQRKPEHLPNIQKDKAVLKILRTMYPMEYCTFLDEEDTLIKLWEIAARMDRNIAKNCSSVPEYHCQLSEFLQDLGSLPRDPNVRLGVMRTYAIGETERGDDPQSAEARNSRNYTAASGAGSISGGADQGAASGSDAKPWQSLVSAELRELMVEKILELAGDATLTRRLMMGKYECAKRAEEFIFQSAIDLTGYYLMLTNLVKCPPPKILNHMETVNRSDLENGDDFPASSSSQAKKIHVAVNQVLASFEQSSDEDLSTTETESGSSLSES